MSTVHFGHRQFHLPVELTSHEQLTHMQELASHSRASARELDLEQFTPAFNRYFQSLPACSKHSADWSFCTDVFKAAIEGSESRSYKCPSVITSLREKSQIFLDALNHLLQHLRSPDHPEDAAIACLEVAVLNQGFEKLLTRAEKVETLFSKVIAPVELPPISISPELRKILTAGFDKFHSTMGMTVCEALHEVAEVDLQMPSPELDEEDIRDCEALQRILVIQMALMDVTETLRTALTPLTPDDERSAKLMGTLTDELEVGTDGFIPAVLMGKESIASGFPPEQVELMQKPAGTVIASFKNVEASLAQGKDDAELEAALRDLLKSDIQWREVTDRWQKLETKLPPLRRPLLDHEILRGNLRERAEFCGNLHTVSQIAKGIDC
ncbi:MAG: hypothetical protein KDK78_00810, partial [Chlamydiia bacterium]|nr:hypothetical protein [Chlamydiia bacterium]